MPDMEDELSDLKLQVGLLGRDIQQHGALFERLSQSIEKIQEVNFSLLRLISLHEEKHEHHERAQEGFQQDIKDLHSRITTSIRDVMDAIDKSEAKVLQVIESHMSHRGGDEPTLYSMVTMGKYAKFLWTIIVIIFFVGYYTAKIQPWFLAVTSK
jgi:chromosome segregation ATPase